METEKTDSVWGRLKPWASTLTKKSTEHIVSVWKQDTHLFQMVLEAASSGAEIWKSCWIYSPWVPYFSSSRDNLIMHFSRIKCALCSHLQTSGKSLWLVCSAVYSSCRLLSSLLSWGRWAITPFKEPFSWKLPRVCARHFPQSTKTVADNRRNWQFGWGGIGIKAWGAQKVHVTIKLLNGWKSHDRSHVIYIKSRCNKDFVKLTLKFN